MAYKTATGKIHFAMGNITTAQANAGYIIAPARTGKSICVDGGHLTAKGGSTATCTSVDFKDTSDVVAVAFAQGSLTADTRLDVRAAAGVTLTTFQMPLTVNKALKIDNTGSSAATATSFDYCVEYIYV